MRIPINDKTKLLAVVLAGTVVLSTIVGPASAALVLQEGSDDTESLAAGTDSDQLAVEDSDKINSTENISVWQRSVLPLRPTEPNFGGVDSRPFLSHQMSNSKVFVSIGDLGSTSFAKDTLYVYNQTEISTTFNPNRPADSDVIDGEKVQLVKVKVGKDASLPRSTEGVGELLTSNDDTTAEVVDTTTGTSGEQTFSFTPEESGQYIFAVVLVEDETKDGLVPADVDGNLRASSEVTVVGFDQFLVQSGRSDVSTRDTAAIGETIEVEADATSLNADTVSHTVILLNESKVGKQEQTIVVNNDGELVEVESSVASIEGATDIESETSFAGSSLASSQFRGSTDIVSLISQMTGESTNVTQTDDAVIYTSQNGTVGAPQQTIDIRTTENFTPGEYSVIHFATAQNGTETVSSKETITLADGVELELTANRTNVTRGEDIRFDVTRADNGNPVNATVEFGDASGTTGPDGSIVLSATQGGEVTATASKDPVDGEAYRSDSLTVAVDEPATITYSGLQVPSAVEINENATVSVDVANTGDRDGQYDATLTVNGTPVESQTRSGSLAAGEGTTLEFTTSFETAGDRAIGVDDTQASEVPDSQTMSVSRNLVDLNVTANESRVTNGSDVLFTVTRDDTGEAVNATVEFDGETKDTDESGEVAFTASNDGVLQATASKAPTATDEFAPDSVNVTVAEPAEFTYSDLSIAPTSVIVNETVTVTATVTNNGDSEGTYFAALRVESTERESQEGTLGAGESATVEFTTSFETAGDRQLSVGEMGVPDRGTDTVTVSVEQADVELAVESNVSQVDSGEDVAFTVTRRDDQSAVSNAVVTVGETKQTTDENGQAVFTLTGDGNINVTANKDLTPSTRFLTGETTVEVLGPAELIYSNLSVSDDAVQFGDSVTVTADVTNAGDLAGEYNATLTVNGEPVGPSTPGTLEPGDTTTVEFSTTFDDETAVGDQTVSIDDVGSLEPTFEFEPATVSVNEEVVSLNLAANTSTPVRGDDIEFTVTENESGAPVENAEVVAGDASGETDSDGTVVLSVTGDGELVAEATKPTSETTVFERDTLTLDVRTPATMTYADLSVSPSDSIHVDDPITVEATVTNVGDVSGPYNASLAINGSTVGDDRTGTIGPGETMTVTFETDFATPGDRILSVVDRVRDTETGTQRVTIQRQTVGLTLEATDIDYEDAGDNEVVDGNDVRFTVTRDDTLSPVENAEIEVDGVTKRTDENGTAVFVITGEGTVTATVSKAQTNRSRFTDDSLTLTVLEPAQIEYSNLEFNQTRFVDNGTVAVNATIRNTGDIPGEYNATLVVDDEFVGAEQNGTLAAGESTTVTFMRTFPSGEYEVTIGDAEVAGSELISRTVQALEPANTGVTETAIASDRTITVSDRFTTEATVVNTGDMTGTLTVNLSVTDTAGDRVITASKRVAVDGGESKTVTFSELAPAVEGVDQTRNFTVSVNGATAPNELAVTRPDSTPPTVRLGSPPQGAVPYGTTVALNVSDGESGVDSVVVEFENQTETLSIDASGTATFDLTGVDEGETTVLVSATDESGNTILRGFTYDLVSAPTVDEIDADGVLSAESTIRAEFSDDEAGEFESGIDDSTTELSINGEPVEYTRTESGLELHLSELPEGTLDTGENTLELRITDNAGNAAVETTTFLYDDTAPVVTLRPAAVENRSTEQPFEMSVTANDDTLEAVTVTVSDSNGTVFERNVTASALASTDPFDVEWDTTDNGEPVDGKYNVTVRTRDAAGNVEEASTSTPVVADNTAPSVTVTDLAGESPDGTAPIVTNASANLTVGYEASESASVTYTVDAVGTGATETFTREVDAGAGEHQLALASELPDDEYELRVSAEDGAANENETTVDRTVTLDTNEPDIAATVAADQSGGLDVNVTSSEPLGGQPTVEVATPNGSTLDVQLTNQSDTSFTGTLDIDDSGQYSLTASGTDLAGNHDTDESVTNVTAPDLSENPIVIVKSSSEETFIRVEADENADLPSTTTTITLSQSEIPPSVLAQGSSATQFIEANAGLNENQIEKVTYGFEATEGVPEGGFFVVYFDPVEGPTVLPTERVDASTTFNTGNLEGDYFIANRSGLSTYAGFTNDSVAPEVTFQSPDDETFLETRDEVAVNATLSDDDSGVNKSSVTVTLNGQDVTDDASVSNESVNYTVTDLEPDTSYTVNVTADDNNFTANTGSNETTFTIAADDTPPELTVQPDDDQTFDYDTETVELNATYAENETDIDTENITVEYDESDVTGSVDFADGTLGVNDTLSVNVSVEPGEHTVTVAVPDKAGNVNNTTNTFVVTDDTTPPTITFTNLNEGEQLENTTDYKNVSANVTDGVSGVDATSIEVTYDGRDVTSAAGTAALDNVYYNATNLSPGTNHTVAVSAADEAGKTNTTAINFSIESDSTPPDITNVTSADESFGSTENVTGAVNYTDPESGIDTSSVTLLINGEPVSEEHVTVFPNPGAAFDLGTQTLESGDHRLETRVTNSEGDTTTNTTTFSASEGPDIDVTSASLNRSDVLTDESVTVDVTVENFGDESGKATFAVTNETGTQFGSAEGMTVASGATEQLTFEFVPSTAGEFDLEVNGTSVGTLTVTSRTADIRVADAAVNRSDIRKDDPFTIEFRLENHGTESGTVDNVTLDGEVVEQVDSSLAAGQVRTLTVTDSQSATGFYTYEIAGDNVSGEITTVAVSEPNFVTDVQDAVVSETAVDTGDSVTVEVPIRNRGTAAGTFSGTLTTTDISDTKSVSIAAEDTESLTYTISFDSSGTYTLALNNREIGTVEVSDGRSGGSGGGGGGVAPPRDRDVSTSITGSASVETDFDGDITAVSINGARTGDSVELTFSESAVADDMARGAALNRITVNFGSEASFDAQVSYDETNPSSTVPDLDTETGAEAFGYINVAHEEDDEAISGVTFEFTVTQERLDERGLDAEEVSLYRYQDGGWTEYDASIVSESDGAVTYTAEVPGLSVFAIGESRQIQTQSPTTTEPPTTTTEPPTSTDSPGFGLLITVIALLAAALFALRRD